MVIYAYLTGNMIYKLNELSDLELTVCYFNGTII